MSEVDSAPTNAATDPYSQRELVLYSLRLIGGFVLVFGAVVLLARHFRVELQAIGFSFVERFGYAGMTLGTFLADGFHVPIPPQAYMLIAVTSKSSPPASFIAIAIGSFLGGSSAYFLGLRLSENVTLRKKLAPLQHMFDRMWDRFGHRALLFASIAPIPYSTVCWLTGINRLPTSAYWVLSVFRVPRLLVFYGLIAAGWNL